MSAGTTPVPPEAVDAALGPVRVLPVVSLDDAAAAVPLAEALAEGGITAVEITFRTAEAARAIEAIAASCPQTRVGAGTLLTPEDVRRAVDAGARFGISPGWDPQTEAAAAETGLPYIPGVATAAEAQQRLAQGYRTLKFFPAEAAGGRTALRQLLAPFRRLDPSFIPTGGIGADSLSDWLSIPGVRAVGGSWLAPEKLITAGDWTGIAALASDAVAASSPREDLP